ncbi:hypothetical protein PVK06_021074 [Gossypium arboreum]|uniref:Uncharacterized protein n=1 Tax=Gossypium arboreum TaxID=29729 RepID=A0ABR0PP20_GOSAR|nr:hypothetical protein PVK06_021074 [Gossypium arboreum]
MSDQMSLMIELLQRRYEAMTQLEEVVHDVPNLDHVDHEVDIAVELEVALKTSTELQPVLNESVEKTIHFLAKTKEVPTEGVNGFIPFLYDEKCQAHATKSLHNIETRKLKPIISQKMI